MINEKDEETLTKNINKINYYNEKIEENNSLCRKISIFSFFLCFISLLLDFKLFKFLIIVYFIWRVIMFFIKKDYSNKIIYYSGKESVIECNNCGYYKYADRKCNNCGFDDSPKEDEKEELSKFYDNRIALIHILCFIIVGLIIFVDIKLIASIYGNEDNSLALNLFTFGNPSLILIILVVTGFLLCFFVILGFNNIANRFYIKKKLLIDEDSKKTNRE